MNGLRPYTVRFTVSASLWMTTTGDEDMTERKRRRGRLRAYGRQVWRETKAVGAPRVNRYMMLVTVGGRRESPVLAAETMKPLIDAGTDEGLWPDDGPVPSRDDLLSQGPRPLPGGRAELFIWVIPLGPDTDPLTRLLACMPGSKATLATATFGEDSWLTSNMRMTARERKTMQTRAMRACRNVWKASPGADCGVVCQVRYPDSRPRYKGDPDNTAETATAMWGVGVLAGLLPASPSIFCFMLADGESEPKHHDLDMLAFTTPPDVDWPGLLVA